MDEVMRYQVAIKMLDIITIKGVVLVVMFVITFICSMFPLCFVRHIRHTHETSRRLKYQSWLSLMSCFAGGVFMGTCIMDLFPDVQEQIDILIDEYMVQNSFPVAEFVVLFGFLLVLTVEQLVLDYKETSLLNSPAESQSLFDTPEDRRQNLQREHSLSGITGRPDLTASIRSEAGSINNGDEGYGTIETHEHTHEHAIFEEAASHSSLRSVLLLFALSLHSVFEGLAVGLQDTIDNVVALFAVVILHKGIIAMSLGLNMVQSRLTLFQMISANLFFCVTSPVGVGIGMGITEMQTTLTTALISGTLQGIACGTFLYVTFFEVLPHEMNNGLQRIPKLMFVVLGFTTVCGVLFLDPDTQRPHCYQPPQPVPP
ncbi:zinc transporter ZIP1-like isoform X2 [Oratosquilla oratoria]|uniref:zinc transporter ZIP1-like isoform X2 n=1 Tax=Oratosquilla oratoria TaxID=337810 RepID=UPI003F7580A3